MKNSLVIACIVVLLNTLALTGCGYHLRGYDKPVFQNSTIDLKIANANEIHNKTSRNLEKHITTRLLVLGATVNSNYSKRNNLSQLTNTQPNDMQTQVTVNNINLRKHRLVGTLTEIQLLMTADVIISTKNKKPLTRMLQVQRSYQYDQATVNTANQQEGRIIELMNEAMADKVARQVSLYERVNVQ